MSAYELVTIENMDGASRIGFEGNRQSKGCAHYCIYCGSGRDQGI